MTVLPLLVSTLRIALSAQTQHRQRIQHLESERVVRFGFRRTDFVGDEQERAVRVEFEAVAVLPCSTNTRGELEKMTRHPSSRQPQQPSAHIQLVPSRGQRSQERESGSGQQRALAAQSRSLSLALTKLHGARGVDKRERAIDAHDVRAGGAAGCQRLLVCRASPSKKATQQTEVSKDGAAVRL